VGAVGAARVALAIDGVFVLAFATGAVWIGGAVGGSHAAGDTLGIAQAADLSVSEVPLVAGSAGAVVDRGSLPWRAAGSAEGGRAGAVSAGRRTGRADLVLS